MCRVAPPRPLQVAPGCVGANVMSKEQLAARLQRCQYASGHKVTGEPAPPPLRLGGYQRISQACRQALGGRGLHWSRKAAWLLPSPVKTRSPPLSPRLLHAAERIEEASQHGSEALEAAGLLPPTGGLQAYRGWPTAPAPAESVASCGRPEPAWTRVNAASLPASDEGATATSASCVQRAPRALAPAPALPLADVRWQRGQPTDEADSCGRSVQLVQVLLVPTSALFSCQARPAPSSAAPPALEGCADNYSRCPGSGGPKRRRIDVQGAAAAATVRAARMQAVCLGLPAPSCPATELDWGLLSHLHVQLHAELAVQACVPPPAPLPAPSISGVDWAALAD